MTTDDLRTCSHSFVHCACDPYCDVIKCTKCDIDRREDDHG